MSGASDGPSRGWTPEAARCLERAFAYAGGVDAWRSIRRVRLFWQSLSGFIPTVRGNGRTFHFPRVVDVFPHERRTIFLDYPEAGSIGVFERGAIRFETQHGGSVLFESDDPRASFRGFARERRWSPADALYFFGYALWHYHSLPFTLAEARLIAHAATAATDVLEVEIPADVPTHCRRQRFHFEPSGRLVRHDYHAEVVGFWARGAHLWNEPRCFDGFPIAMERRVLPLLGSLLVPADALLARLSGAEIERN